MTTRAVLAKALAQAFLSGEWHWTVLLARGLAVVPDATVKLRAAVFEVLARWPRPPLDDEAALEHFLAEGLAWRWPLGRVVRVPDGPGRWAPAQVRRWLPFSPPMRAGPWPVRTAASRADLLAWLELDDGQLDWFADRRGFNLEAPPGPLHHYRRVWCERPGRLPRLLEAPAPRLKAVQRRILRDVLDHIPAHEAAHGFVRGRSVLTHAALHQGQGMVVRVDLESFFTQVSTARVGGLFRAAGYPPEVALTLLSLCTTRTPAQVLRTAPLGASLRREYFFLRRRLSGWHLPQGAPTSPALANLVCFMLDARLTGLAQRLGATYSRYADDLVFSGARLPLAVLLAQVGAICLDEGLRVNPQKTRVMPSHRRQEVTGLVVNQGARVSREERDRLKATLHGLVRRGEPVHPSVLAALGGRVAWVGQTQPGAAGKLKGLLARLAGALPISA
jgi:hypothetical protein